MNSDLKMQLRNRDEVFRAPRSKVSPVLVRDIDRAEMSEIASLTHQNIHALKTVHALVKSTRQSSINTLHPHSDKKTAHFDSDHKKPNSNGLKTIKTESSEQESEIKSKLFHKEIERQERRFS